LLIHVDLHYAFEYNIRQYIVDPLGVQMKTRTSILKSAMGVA